jgi:hypothetical protein
MDILAARREPVRSISCMRRAGPSPKNFSFSSFKNMIFVAGFIVSPIGTDTYIINRVPIFHAL